MNRTGCALSVYLDKDKYEYLMNIKKIQGIPISYIINKVVGKYIEKNK